MFGFSEILHEYIIFTREFNPCCNIYVLYIAILNFYQLIFSLFKNACIPLTQSSLARAFAFIVDANVSESSRESDCTDAIICLVYSMDVAELVVMSR
jgi:hypothetical protein